MLPGPRSDAAINRDGFLPVLHPGRPDGSQPGRECAGIEKTISPHSLRHCFITAALDAGVPLGDVQEAVSHADPENNDALRQGPALTRQARHLPRRRSLTMN
ncbi:MAG: tyrosine-type recombinase/integrase [Acidimicrobiia bacterium]